MKETLKLKLQKILALARKGVDGEKVNAEILLQAMLDKHDLSLADIEDITKEVRYYEYTTLENRRLVIQIMGHVTNRTDIYGVKGHKLVAIEADTYEDIMIKEMIAFHSANLKKEKKQILDDLFSAYVHKHNIFVESNGERPREAVDYEKLHRMLRLKNSLSDTQFQKQLEK